MTLLAFAPVAHVLASDGKLLLAVLCWFGIQAVEPLPDQDFRLPMLTHRGVSHSLLGVFVVGGILGGAGWFLGGHGFKLLYDLLSTFVGVWDWLLGLLPELSASILAGLVPNIPPDEIVTTLQQQAGGSVDRSSFAIFGFFIGAYGVLAHLLGDVITVRGIKPFLPFSGWRFSVSSLRADSPVANAGLFGVGVLAIVVVLVATVPGAILGAGTPADLSPVGVAGAQDSGAHNGSVQINDTRTNQTQVVLESVTLPQNGYIVAQTGNDSGNQSGTVVGHTQYVRNGTFENVILELNETADASSKLSVTLYNDSTGDETLNVTGGIADTPYRTANGTPVRDSVQLGANGSESIGQNRNATTTNATVELDSTNNTTATNVTITEATLPDGGFVALHGEGFNQSGTLRGTEIAASGYLTPGTHRNLTLPVEQGVPGSSNVSRLNDTRANLSLVAYRDTDNNAQFGYTASKGRNDTPYETSDGGPVSDTGTVVLESNVERVNQQSQPAAATFSFADQQVQQRDGNASVVVRNVSLAEGGFIGIHTADFLPPTRQPIDSGLGHSQYLTAGNHSNIIVRLPPGSLAGNQTLVAVPYLDTNGNQRYDYTRSGGETDYAYIEQQNNSTVLINETATVRVPRSLRATSPASTSSITSTTVSEEPTQTATTDGNATRGAEGEQKGLLSGYSLLQLLGGALVIVLAPTVIRRLTRGR
ncbi:hypothetical protein C450_20886 [Halococcus salifodinae DSM 8989]|uniref:DUF7282 domain-containing protein n=2 Tax=Halococcus salifodinae TaxID=36738 RepID=M0MST5_9EURY|nr:hypothetical protein C450_20886 [Halococcus salifodinae DSM 8989]